MSFTLISDVTQIMKPNLFGLGWYCLGVAKTPGSNISKERFYFLLMESNTSKAFIEEYVDFPEFFKKIEDNKLWNDLFCFFYEKGLVTISKGKEIKIASNESKR
mgnify:CR=1 FL=1